MTTSLPTNQPVMNGEGSQHVQTGIVEGFVRILSHLSADKDCQEITSLVDEMDALRARNEKLQSEVENSKITETTNLAAIQQVMNGKQEVDRRYNQKDAELQKAKLQASEAEKKLRAALEEKAELKMRLETNREEIDKAMTSQKQKDALISDLNKNVRDVRESAKRAEKDLKEAHEAEQAQAKKRYEVAKQELESFRKRAPRLKSPSEVNFSEQLVYRLNASLTCYRHR